MVVSVSLEIPECVTTYRGNGIVQNENGRNVLQLDIIEEGCTIENLETSWDLTKVRNSE